MIEQNGGKEGPRKWWVSDTKSPGLMADCRFAAGHEGYHGLQGSAIGICDWILLAILARQEVNKLISHWERFRHD